MGVKSLKPFTNSNEYGKLYWGTTTTDVTNEASYYIYGSSVSTATLVSSTVTSVYIKFVTSTPAEVTDVEYKVHDPLFGASTSSYQSGQLYPYPIHIDRPSVADNRVLQSSPVYLQTTGVPSYVAPGIVVSFTRVDPTATGTTAISYTYGSNTVTNAQIVEVQGEVSNGTSTVTTTVAAFPDYSPHLISIAKSLSSLAQNISYIADLSAKGGIHTRGAYDWVSLITTYQILVEQGGLLTEKNNVELQDKVRALNTLSGYYEVLKNSISREF